MELFWAILILIILWVIYLLRDHHEDAVEGHRQYVCIMDEQEMKEADRLVMELLTEKNIKIEAWKRHSL